MYQAQTNEFEAGNIVGIMQGSCAVSDLFNYLQFAQSKLWPMVNIFRYCASMQIKTKSSLLRTYLANVTFYLKIFPVSIRI